MCLDIPFSFGMGLSTALHLPLRLVRHMTASSCGIEDVVSDLLFVLCKENVRRFVKHVGYGHAAGLLMARGLLGGGASPNVDSYSPDEEDSDTEDYRESVARWAGQSGRGRVGGAEWGGAEWGGRSRGDGLCMCSTGPVDTAGLWSVLL